MKDQSATGEGETNTTFFLTVQGTSIWLSRSCLSLQHYVGWDQPNNLSWLSSPSQALGKLPRRYLPSLTVLMYWDLHPSVKYICTCYL